MPMILPFVIIFVIWLQYEKSKSVRKEHELSQDFWREEHKANSARKKSIEHLNYITIPLQELPMLDTDDPGIKSIQEELTQLSSQKILNLSSYSNTQLKLKYGVGNLDLLTEYDTNYTRLICLLSKWGSCLHKAGLVKEATAVLEYGIQLKTDIKNNYILLAAIYNENGKKDKINTLIQQIEQSDSLLKDSILNELTQISAS